MVRYLNGLEKERRCGYRKVGKLYVIGEGVPAFCHRLPIPLTVCPVCGEGIKFARGWVRINPRKLFGTCKDGIVRCPKCGETMEDRGNVWYCSSCELSFTKSSEKCICSEDCKVCYPQSKAYMLWVGEKFYPTPKDFVDEAIRMGISKVVPSIPKDFKIGKTYVYLAHRKAVKMIVRDSNTLTGYTVKMHSGVFMCFKPTRFEMLVKKTDFEKDREKYIEMEKKGVEIIVVPDNYDELVKSKTKKQLSSMIYDTIKEMESKKISWFD